MPRGPRGWGLRGWLGVRSRRGRRGNEDGRDVRCHDASSPPPLGRYKIIFGEDGGLEKVWVPGPITRDPPPGIETLPSIGTNLPPAPEGRYGITLREDGEWQKRWVPEPPSPGVMTTLDSARQKFSELQGTGHSEASKTSLKSLNEPRPPYDNEGGTDLAHSESTILRVSDSNNVKNSPTNAEKEEKIVPFRVT